MAKKRAVVVLAAGVGKRMHSSKPKCLQEVATSPMIEHLFDSINKVKIDKSVVVLGPNMEEVYPFIGESTVAIQEERLGSAHAFLAAENVLQDFDGSIVVLYGDTPLVTSQDIENMFIKLEQGENKMVVMAFESHDPFGYGRLIIAGEKLLKIVEEKDANKQEKNINICNSGIMGFHSSYIWNLAKEIENKNSQNEYYLTDSIMLGNQKGLDVSYVLGNEENFLGVNTKMQLAFVENLVQKRLQNKLLEQGVAFVDIGSVYLSFDTKIGKESIVYPNVYFGRGVEIGENVIIKSFSHIEGAVIKSGAIIGPFARLRPEAVIDENVSVGNFVEIKKSHIAKNSKINHLSYVGDSEVGENVNIGAGVITCNFDGKNKHKTKIGNNAFIGSNSSIIAPCEIEEDAIIGAGSTINKKRVEKGSLALTRPEMKELKNYRYKGK